MANNPNDPRLADRTEGDSFKREPDSARAFNAGRVDKRAGEERAQNRASMKDPTQVRREEQLASDRPHIQRGPSSSELNTAHPAMKDAAEKHAEALPDNTGGADGSDSAKENKLSVDANRPKEDQDANKPRQPVDRLKPSANIES